MENYKLNKSKWGTHNLIAQLLGKGNSILDVGCNKGYLKDIAPENDYYGIDADKKALAVCKNKYKKVYEADLNIKIPKIEEKFDIIVFADVLEHLKDPEVVLKYFVDHNLGSNGCVILSLPNVAHLSVRVGLIFGSFNYTDCGILDKSHCHLYTSKSAKQLISKGGLIIKKRLFSSDRFGFLINKLSFLGDILGFNLIFECKKS